MANTSLPPFDPAVPWETRCPGSEDGAHCDHWYDDEAPCCRCNDDGERGHGDHHPSLDCASCAERIRDGRTTYSRVYELAERRYQQTGASF